MSLAQRPKPLSTIVIEPTNWKRNGDHFGGKKICGTGCSIVTLKHNKSQAHWFDKFSSAGEELNRDRTKDHPAEYCNNNNNSRKKNTEKIVFSNTASTEMIFLSSPFLLTFFLLFSFLKAHWVHSFFQMYVSNEGSS